MRGISQHSLVAAISACCLLIAGWAAEAKELKFITIGVAPWASYDPETNEPRGAFPKLVEEIEARTGFDISITLTPFARVEREMESGGHDCTILVPRSEHLVKHGELVSHHAIGVIPHKDIQLKKYKDLQGLHISLIRGSEISSRFQADTSIEKEYSTDYDIALRKLQRKRTDAIAGAIPTILFLARENDQEYTLGEPLELTQIPLLFQCSLKSKNLKDMEKINGAIQSMHSDGTIEKIENDFFF